MKKLLSLLLVMLTLMTVMVGCGQETVDTTTVPVTEATTQAQSGLLEDIPSYTKTEQTDLVTEIVVETTVTIYTQEGEYDYVLNTNTMKFHYPDCRSVDQIKEENKAFFQGTREEAMEKGYDPCGNCEP